MSTFLYSSPFNTSPLFWSVAMLAFVEIEGNVKAVCVYPCIRLLVIFIEYCSVSKTVFLLLGVCLGHWACIVCDPDKSGERGRRFLQTAQKYTSKMRAQTLSASKQKLKNARSVSIHLFRVTVCRGVSCSSATLCRVLQSPCKSCMFKICVLLISGWENSGVAIMLCSPPKMTCGT